MICFAHRGLSTQENTVHGVLEVFRRTDDLGVEIDVQRNTSGEVVLCHDRNRCDEPHADKLVDLLQSIRNERFHNPKRLMLDIKARGTESAESLARAVVSIVEPYTDSLCMYLCSFNEFCVAELVRWKRTQAFQVGVITSGVPLHWYKHWMLDFVSIDYEMLCEEIVERFKQNVALVFTWVVREPDCANVDGVIYNVKSI